MGKLTDGAAASYYYFITFYGRYFSTPLGVLGHASTIYFLTLTRFPALIRLFPSFLHFIATIGITLYVVGALGGKYIHFRGTPYRREREVQVHADPYSTMKILPNLVPLYEYIGNESRRQGYDELADRIDVLVKRSEKIL